MASYSIDDVLKNANISKRHKGELDILINNKTYYHIINSKISSNRHYSIPINVPRRTLRTEDNTILRVCVADTINHCLCAIGGHDDVSYWGINDTQYSIYAITPNLLIQPSKNLVPDVEFTKEKWLINYDGKHEFYNFNKIGEILGICNYYTKNIHLLDKEEEKKAVSIYGLKLEVESRFNNSTVLRPGYYKITNTQTFKNGSENHNFNGYKTTVKEETGSIEDMVNSYYAVEKIGSYQELLTMLSPDNYHFPF